MDIYYYNDKMQIKRNKNNKTKHSKQHTNATVNDLHVVSTQGCLIFFFTKTHESDLICHKNNFSVFQSDFCTRTGNYFLASLSYKYNNEQIQTGRQVAIWF